MSGLPLWQPTPWRADCFFPGEGRIQMRRYISTFILGVALAAPIAVVAKDDHPKRYYDRDKRDYHEWNEREERAYRHWLEERREQRAREFNRLRHEQQYEYWRWRHEHPDNMIFPDRR